MLCELLPWGPTTRESPKTLASRISSITQRKTKGQAAFPQPDLMYRFELNCSWWAKGDLNPHVPKDTGT